MAIETLSAPGAAAPATTPRGFAGPDIPDPAIISRCVHCGLCLPVCPTYRETYVESSSPRGRIHLIGAVAEGRLSVDNPVFRFQMAQCLNCRACEAACPTGVHHGAILEASRAQIVRHVPPDRSARLLRAVVFGWLFRDMARFRFVSRLVAAYQRLGLQRAVRRSGLFDRLGLRRVEALTPSVRGRFFVARGQSYPPLPTDRSGSRVAPTRQRHHVALLAGCIQSTAFARVDRATVRVLRRNGCRVDVPAGQGCCGALHTHGGDLDGGRELARRNIAAFERTGAPVYLVNAAGCGAALKEYGELLAADPIWAERAKRFSDRVRDVTEFLAALDLVPPTRPLRLRATYQEACHLAHAQRVTAAPRKLLGAIPGLELVEMAEASLCCGSAGVYNLIQPDMADRLQRRKVVHILETGADVVVSANPGCMIQIEAGLRAKGSGLPVRHVMELLDAAYAG